MDQFSNRGSSDAKQAISFKAAEAAMDTFVATLSKDDPKKLNLFAKKLVEVLLLTQINPELSVSKTNLELALHQQEVIRNFIWAWGFQFFMKFWLSHVEPAQTKDPVARGLYEARNKKALAHLRDEKVHPGTRLLIRRSLESMTVSLMELVRTVCPKDGSHKQYRYRQRVRENSLKRLDEVLGPTKRQRTVLK